MPHVLLQEMQYAMHKHHRPLLPVLDVIVLMLDHPFFAYYGHITSANKYLTSQTGKWK